MLPQRKQNCINRHNFIIHMHTLKYMMSMQAFIASLVQCPMIMIVQMYMYMFIYIEYTYMYL